MADPDLLPFRLTRTLESSGQPADSFSGDSSFIRRDGGQRRAAVAALLNVVEADHGDVLRDPKSLLPKGMHGAERERVVEAENGVRGIAKLE
jgi:hypothetical protein